MNWGALSVVVGLVGLWALNFIAFVVAVMPLLQALVLFGTLIYTAIQIRMAWHAWKRRKRG